MIDRWNHLIHPNDVVWHLGDFSFRSTNEKTYFDRLNGRKHLIVGNHDSKGVLRLPWHDLRALHEISSQGVRVVLCHYPLLEWNHYYRGALHFHGHQHNKTALQRERQIDVGVDANEFYPWPIEELIKLGS